MLWMGNIWELEEQYRPGILLKFHDKHGTDTASMGKVYREATGKSYKYAIDSQRTR